ncbi:unnamed protein product [Spirodela intermedia]|uniref:Uncharacterized protein n=1 Tax=Spirodela intermedia TaxID=51605 RepID=A0A7I8KUR0_SPIIN|nr:unnamed protein product [Spirodela intermedia]
MARRSSLDPAADGGSSLQAAALPVFIDTNIDTHIALTVSLRDTVADLKRKARIEHVFCFPNIGDINIVALKVITSRRAKAENVFASESWAGGYDHQQPITLTEVLGDGKFWCGTFPVPSFISFLFSF